MKYWVDIDQAGESSLKSYDSAVEARRSIADFAGRIGAQRVGTGKAGRLMRDGQEVARYTITESDEDEATSSSLREKRVHDLFRDMESSRQAQIRLGME